MKGKKKKKQKQLIYLMKDEESLKYQRCRQSKNKWAYPQSWPNSYGVVVISKILFFVSKMFECSLILSTLMIHTKAMSICHAGYWVFV